MYAQALLTERQMFSATFPSIIIIPAFLITIFFEIFNFNRYYASTAKEYENKNYLLPQFEAISNHIKVATQFKLKKKNP